jgi:uncharacterized membrane protein YedE/YeeE
MWVSLAGGLLIGAGAALLLLAEGRVAGISGVVGGLLRPRPGSVAWRVWFLAGLIGGGALFALARGAQPLAPARAPLLVASGLLVGFGTRLSGGCTSGHGVCGVGRLSRRSIVATLIFMATGALAVLLVRP